MLFRSVVICCQGARALCVLEDGAVRTLHDGFTLPNYPAFGPDGKIGRIAANTVPMSLDPVPSIDPVSAVLEIAGGRAAELGIKEGDKVSWPH